MADAAPKPQGDTTHRPLADGVRYKRVLLKMSGEALLGEQPFGLDPSTVSRLAGEVQAVIDLGVEVCLVIGGGNIFRGVTGAAAGMDRVSADNIGMLGTLINALAMQSALEHLGIHTRVQSAIPMSAICEPLIPRRALRHMEKGRVVIFAAGVGSPFRPHYVPPKWAATRWSRRPRSTVFTTATRKRTPRLSASSA